jgi:hypothetical protein
MPPAAAEPGSEEWQVIAVVDRCGTQNASNNFSVSFHTERKKHPEKTQGAEMNPSSI